MNRTQRQVKLTAMLLIVRQDFERMNRLLGPVADASPLAISAREYLERQIVKYLKPYTSAEFRLKLKLLSAAVQAAPLMNAENDQGASSLTRPNWDTEGVGGGDVHMNWKLRLAPAYSGFARFGALRIRVKAIAFATFPEITFRGVLVHELTHFVLDTEDIHYSSFTRNSVMKELPNGSDNADNWRIFYQKTSEYFAKIGFR